MLANKVAIVTGASRGIGRAIAQDLAANGAKVVINYNSSQSEADNLVAEIVAAGGQAIAVKANVANFEEAQALIKATIESFGQIDILVNNAGTTRDTLLMTMSENDWDTVIDTNLKSIFNCCKAALRPMLRRKQGGRIINITSIVGLVGQGGQANYAASKAGIIGFTKSLAKEIGPRQITVNAVAPGYFPTALTAVLSEEMAKKAIEHIPLGRMGQLEEVAYMVTFLASDKAAYITGEVIRIDGGMAM